MTEFALGPFILSAERVIWILATLTFWGAAALASRNARPDLNPWAFHASIAAFIGARAAFVLMNFTTFWEAPLTIIAFWQGGFSLWGGVVAFLAVSALHLARKRQALPYAAMAASAPVLVVFVLTQLLHPPMQQLPTDHRLSDLEGTMITLEGPAVINLWASWCPPCRREMPMMVDQAKASPQVPIHFINQGEGSAKIRSYLSQEGLVMTPLLDPVMTTMQHFGILGLPATLFIDAQGRVTHSHYGEISRAALRKGISDLQR